MKKIFVIIILSILFISIIGFAYADLNSNSSNVSGKENKTLELVNKTKSSVSVNKTLNVTMQNKSNNPLREKIEAGLRDEIEAGERAKKIIEEKNRRNLGNLTKEEKKIIKDERHEKIREFREKIKKNEGKVDISGKNITIKELNEEQKTILAGKINAKTGLNLTSDDIGNGNVGSVLRTYLSNGRNAEVKVMPDRASATALKRLRAKCSDRNCTVELKEVNIDGRTRLVYEIQTDKDSNVFLLFKNKMIVKAQVDAETGEIISAKKPWWAFIAKEKNADDKEIEADVSENTSAIS